jgi:deoxyribonuclease V
LAGRGRGRRRGGSLIAILDAAYGDATSAVACITAADWGDAKPVDEIVLRRGPQKAYAPGEFYRRELPLLLSALGKLHRSPDAIVIDGYAWLDAKGRRGHGAHLFEELGQETPVIGIAKTRFAGADKFAGQIIRGKGSSPLYVTAAGIDAGMAVASVRTMHGEHRIPTLVARADKLARKALEKS